MKIKKGNESELKSREILEGEREDDPNSDCRVLSIYDY